MMVCRVLVVFWNCWMSVLFVLLKFCMINWSVALCSPARYAVKLNREMLRLLIKAVERLLT